MFLEKRKIKSRHFLIAGLLLAAAFLAIPHQALAVPWWLTPSGLFSGLIGGLLKLLLKLASSLMHLTTWLVGVAVSNPFNISYTRPGPTAPDNFVIEIGWTLLRDLVNMGFILGLAYIGLSTALDFGNKFNTGKTFAKLLIIALIINFTPAICGAVVDMGNILGSFFTQGTDFQTINDIFNRQQDKISQNWTNILTEGVILLNTVMLIGFGLFGALILGIYAILFFARGPIIWILVILSPVAFAAFIFEKTKKEFDKWWNMFLQWAFMMPVVLGFFLYLAQQILVRANEFLNMAGGEGVGGIVNQIAPYMLPLGFLALGLFLGTTSLMPKGAGGIMGLAKTGGIAALAITGGAVGVGGAFKGSKSKVAKAGAAFTGRIHDKVSAGAKAGLTGAQNAWQRGTEGALKPGDPGYDAWKNQSWGNKVRAGMGTAGRYVFGGESDKERTDWTKSGGAKWARRAAIGVATIGTGGATIWGKRLTRKIGTALDVGDRTDKDMAEGTEKFKKKTRKERESAINNALPGALGRKTRLEATLAAIEAGDDMKDYKTLTKYKKKDIIKDAFKYAPQKLNTIKNLDPELTAEVTNDMKLSNSFKKKFGLDMSADDYIKYGGAQTVKTKGADGKEIDEIDPTTGEKKLKRDVDGKIIPTKEYKGYKDEKGNTIDLLAVKLMAEIKAKNMGAWTDDIANKAVTAGIANDFWDGARVGKAAEQFGSKFVNKLNDKFEGKEAKPVNAVLAKYVNSSAGQALGLSAPKAILTKRGTETIIKQVETPELKELKQALNEKRRERDALPKLDLKRINIEKEIEEMEKEYEAIKPQPASQATSTGGQTAPPEPESKAEPTIEKPPKGNIKGGKRVKE